MRGTFNATDALYFQTNPEICSDFGVITDLFAGIQPPKARM
jgi:hypothetical protein